MLVPPSELGAAAPRLLLQGVPEDKSAKNRLHLDIHVADIEAEAQRLEAAGATRIGQPLELGDTRWVVMADPEGNEFCVCSEGGASPRTRRDASAARRRRRQPER